MYLGQIVLSLVLILRTPRRGAPGSSRMGGSDGLSLEMTPSSSAPPLPPAALLVVEYYDRPTTSAQVKNPAHTQLGWRRRRSSSSSAAGAGPVIAGLPVAAPGVTSSLASAGPRSPTGAATEAGAVKWMVDRVSSKGSLTRGQRLALSHRHYNIRAAVEVLRRSPLPETAVWRKMREIVGARFVDIDRRSVVLFYSLRWSGMILGCLSVVSNDYQMYACLVRSAMFLSSSRSPFPVVEHRYCVMAAATQYSRVWRQHPSFYNNDATDALFFVGSASG